MKAAIALAILATSTGAAILVAADLAPIASFYVLGCAALFLAPWLIPTK